ncbi:MAG: rod shape-determining protein MreD [Pseudomonadota bacterium]|nr:rod shape-determining protein MreD [Pseudomonadota bacterium]
MSWLPGVVIILTSIVFAMILAVIALPDYVPLEVGYLRPQWVALVVIYWVIALPHRCGPIIAWFSGLALDVLMSNLLGHHALLLAVTAYAARHLHQRIRMYGVWQQSLVILGMMMCYQMISYWIAGMSGDGRWREWYVLSAVSSALIWPMVFLVLRYLRRQFDVS